jgi:Ca2+/Na+ antiporter
MKNAFQYLLFIFAMAFVLHDMTVTGVRLWNVAMAVILVICFLLNRWAVNKKKQQEEDYNK